MIFKRIVIFILLVSLTVFAHWVGGFNFERGEKGIEVFFISICVGLFGTYMVEGWLEDCDRD